MEISRTQLLRSASAAVMACTMLLANDASAGLIAYDGFDYSTGTLEGENGGSGDWGGSP